MADTPNITDKIPEATPPAVAPVTATIQATPVAPEPAKQPEQPVLSVGSFYDNAPAIHSDAPAQPVSFYQRANEKLRSNFNSDDDAIAEIEELRKRREELETNLSHKSSREFSSDVLAAADYLVHINKPRHEITAFLDYAHRSFNDKNPDGSFAYSNESMIWFSYQRDCSENGKSCSPEGFEAYKHSAFGRYNQTTMEDEINEYALNEAAKREREYSERMRIQVVEDTMKMASAGRSEIDKTRGQKSTLHSAITSAYGSYAKTAPATIDNIPVQGIDLLRASILDRINNGSLLQSWLAPKGTVMPEQIKMLEAAEILMNPSMDVAEKKKLVDRYFTGMVGSEAEKAKRELLTAALSTGAVNGAGQRNISVPLKSIASLDELRGQGMLTIMDGAFQNK